MARRRTAELSPPELSEADDSVSESSTPMPIAIRLTRPHGFVDADGRRHHWHAGYTVSDSDEVELLVSRGAAHTVISD